MANILGLDPKKFKHLKSDEHSTTLQHKDGHVLRIAHNVLNPESRAQLKALSKMSDQYQTSNQAQEAQDQNPGKKMAGGGKIKPQNEHPQIPMQPNDIPGPTTLSYADGTTDVNDPNYEPSPEQQAAYVRQTTPQKSFTTGTSNPSTARSNEYNVKKITEEVEQSREHAEGGKVKMYADPQEPVSNQDSAPESEHPEGLPEAFGRIIGKYGVAPVANFADKAIKGTVAGVKEAGQISGRFSQGVEKGLGIDPNAAPAPEQAPAPRPSAPEQPKQQDMTPSPEAVEQPPEPSPMDAALQQSQNTMQQGYLNELQGLRQEASAKGALGQEQANRIQQNIAQQNDAKVAYQNSFHALEKERQDIAADMANSHIDPEKYWTGDANGNGSHNKIMSGLGIILAGFNPTNSPNAAINFLKFQMEQNLKSQEMNLNTKNNLLRANLQQFGNLRDATDMTRLQQSDILHNQMLVAANQAATPMAKAEMLQKAGQLQMTYAPLRQQFAMRQAMMQLANGHTSVPGSTGHALNYMDVSNPEMAKEYRARYYQPFDVPGGKSIADRPINTEDRNKLVAHDKLDVAAKNLQQFVAQHGGIWDRMNPRDRAVAAQLVLPVQASFREGTLGTVYREGEQPLLDKAIKGQPLDLAQYFLKTEPAKLNQLVKSNDAFKQNLLESYNLRPPHSTKQSQQQTQPQAQPQKGADGRMYIQQGKYMVPVK